MGFIGEFGWAFDFELVAKVWLVGWLLGEKLLHLWPYAAFGVTSSDLKVENGCGANWCNVGIGEYVEVVLELEVVAVEEVGGCFVVVLFVLILLEFG